MEKMILLESRNLHRRPTPGRCVILCLVAMLCFSAAQAQTVKGKVTDETGTGMPGVNVLAKGSTAGSVTDVEGNYSLTLPDGINTLVFSFIGYATQEVSTSGRSTIDVKMAVDAQQLNEVVVVGYGTQQKRDITGAIARVSSEALQEVTAPSVVSQLKGRAAGVDIISNSAVPGGGSQIRIRGNRSMVGAGTNDNQTADALDQPLLVVDGIPYSGNINDINPSDIQSLEILKDARATAIYGSRGSGGVILITTKRGRNGKAEISYDGSHGLSTVMGRYNVFNGQEYADFKKEAAAMAASYTPPATSGYLMTAAEQAALAKGTSTDWQKLIYQTGFVSQHNIGVSGGTETSRYSLNGGYYKDQGIIPNQYFTRYSIRGTIDTEVSKRVKLGLNTLNSLSYQNIPGGAGVPGALVRTTPLAEPYNPDGSVNLLPQAGSTDNLVVSPLTLLSKTQSILNLTRSLRTFNSLYAEIGIVPGLKYRVNVGLNFRQETQNTYDGAQTFTNTSPSLSQTRASVRNLESSSWVIENLLMYEKTFNVKHKIGATALFSTQKNRDQQSQIFGLGVPADYIQNTNMGLALQTSATNPALANSDPNFNPNYLYERGLISYMARATYSYDGRYSLTATVRTDGSSILSPGNQYFTYPAFAAAWNIMNEKFMSNAPAISNLKLRAGYGITSNQGINPYTTFGALSSTQAYNFGQGTAGQQAGYTVTQLPNSSLKWQSTGQFNVGVDFGIWKNRVTGSVEVYSMKTDDILLPVLLPASNGAQSITKNLGKTKGSGLEITLSTINVKTASGLVWSTDLNYFFNREEIVQLTTPDQTEDKNNGWFVGQPLTVIYDVKKIGIWQTGDAGLSTQTSPVQKPGQIRVQDLNGDNVINASDRQVIGNFQPQWEGGMTNRVTFKNFDFSIQLTARMGSKILVPYVSTDGSGNGYTFFMQSRNNQLKVDYWTPTNPTNAFPRPDATTDRTLFSSTLAYMDGSYIKARSINLGYTFPTEMLSKLGLKSLRVYLQAVNPFVIYSPFVKDGFGPDPEGNGYGGAIAPLNSGNNLGVPSRAVSVNLNNPATRQFILGVNLKF